MDWSSFSLGNAAGFVKGPGAEFDEMLRSSATHITAGSFTVDSRDGNPGEVYCVNEDGTSVNSLGLPNPGIAAFELMAGNMADRAFNAGKQFRISIAGFSPEEYGLLASRLKNFGESLEINLGCPNLWGDSGQKPIASFDLGLSEAILDAVVQNTTDQIDVKVSPYSDPRMIVGMASVLKRFRERIRYVVSCNTYPNGTAMKGDKPILTNRYGGVAGNGLHLIALGQVAQFVDALQGTDMKVIGVGGVSSGKRLLAMRDVGAVGVQVGTAFGTRKGRIFSDLIEEVTAIEE